MERLQAALEKARQSRGQREGTAAPARQRERGHGVATDALWYSIPAFDLKDEHLETRRIISAKPGTKTSSFDILRTKVLLQMQQNGWKRLAITSPMPGCGKTTMACNLALGLGRQEDMRTMLLDFDLRDPQVHEFFDVSPPCDLSDVLTGRADVADHLMRVGQNVAVSLQKTPQSDPARLLLAQEAATILDGIQERYKPDMMIFDLPSTIVNDDTLAFLKRADCALIVARANATRYSQFDVCERDVSELTNVLGVVLNAYRY